MDRNQKMGIAVMSVALALLAITFVTAHSLALITPLYTVRMEQASNKMHFLPAAVNHFTYTTEKGNTLNCDVTGCCDAEPFIRTDGPWETCLGSCGTCVASQECGTCSTCSTCSTQCGQNTCGYTCPETCATCVFGCPTQWTLCETGCGC